MSHLPWEKEEGKQNEEQPLNMREAYLGLNGCLELTGAS